LDLAASASDIDYAAFEGEQEKFDREVAQPSGVDSEDSWMQITERGGCEYTWAITFQEVLDSYDLGLETRAKRNRRGC
jgi:hypothetical protein